MDKALPLQAGYAPYAAPLVSFLLIASLTSDVAPSAIPWVLLAKAVVPAALVIWFALRGAYPELRNWKSSPNMWALDVAVGVASAALWVVPYLLFSFDFGDGAFSFLGPDRTKGFDPNVLEAEQAPLLLALRFAGFALVIPVIEELFIRSFVMRFVQEYETNNDFHTLPIARYTRWSLWITAIVFTLGHAPWEWWVALPWFLGTSLWFFRRLSIMSMIVVHAVANAAIFVFVALTSGPLDAASAPPHAALVLPVAPEPLTHGQAAELPVVSRPRQQRATFRSNLRTLPWGRPRPPAQVKAHSKPAANVLKR